MKTFINIHGLAFLLLFLFTSTIVKTQCQGTFGNYPPPYTAASNFGANYLLGTKHTLTVTSTLVGLGYAGNNTATGMQMAIYSNNAGVAGTLIAQTATTTVGSGNITLPVLTQTVLPPGDYWIMAVYQGTGLNNVSYTNSSIKTVDYISLTFGSPLPNTASWTTYTGQDFNYWAVLSSSLVSATNTLCAGSAITLTSTAATSYSWNTGATTQTITVTPSVTTVYTAVAAGGTCPSTNIITVSVTPAPTIAVNSGTICNGSSFSITPTGASSYTISGNTALVFPQTTSVYTVTGRSANGCAASNTALANVNVIVSPTPVVSGNDSLCNGASLSLNASATGASSYSWTGPNNFNTTGSTLAINPITPAGAGVYLVTASFNSGTLTCTTSLSKSINVIQPFPIFISGSNTLCSNAALILTAGSTGVSGYSWAGPNGFSSTGAGININPITNSGGGVYTVTASYPMGSLTCTNSTQQSVQVTAAPVINVAASSFSICAGNQATLTAIGATGYTWTPYLSSQMSFSVGSVTAVSPTTSSSYSVLGTAGSCSSTAVVNITVNPLPAVLASTSKTTVCKGDLITLNASGANTYSWTGGSTAASATVIVGTITDFTVSGATLAGCTGTAAIKLKINSCTGMEDLYTLKVMSIFPNPNSGSFNITVENVTGLTLEVFDALGQKLFSRELSAESNVQINNFSAGIYIARLKDGQNIFAEKKLIVQ